MTIPNNLFRWRYTATAGDTTFQYTNKILVDDDLAVYLNGTLKTLNTDYTVTSSGEPTGGNVVFAMGLAEDDDVLITKDGVDFTQDTDYVENDSFPAEAHEDALDKLTLLCQKIWDYVRRSVKVPITSSLTDLEFPDPEAGTVIAWNGSEDGFMNVTLSGIGGISDEAYSSTTWDGVADVAPSQNAVRDKIETLRDKIETLAASGANADITSMTGLDDDGIPLAKVADAMKDDGSNLAIGSDADGDTYYRASGVLARLAKGTANFKMFMNAAGTAPEWAAGSKIVKTTHDISVTGEQAITGFGFKPGLCFILAVVNSTSLVSFGFDDGTDADCLSDMYAQVANQWTYGDGDSIKLIMTTGARAQAHITTLGSDGITLTWTKIGSPTGEAQIFIAALR